MTTGSVTSITSESEAVQQGANEAQLWLSKIEERQEDQSEKDWRVAARLAVAVFEAKQQVEGSTIAYSKPMFNIYHSNIQTLVPAVYNSTPVPDVRRRYGDRDPIARLASVIAERSLTSSLDGYDFDHVMKRTVRSACIAGRGVPRLRYVPMVGMAQDDPESDPYERVLHEDAKWEIVPWERFGHGDGESWEHVPFIWFEHDLTKDQVREMILPPEPQLPEMPPEPQRPTDPMLTGDPMADEDAMAMHSQALDQFGDAVIMYGQAKAMRERMQAEYEKAVTEALQRLERLPFGKKTIEASEVIKAKPTKGIVQTCKCYEIWDKASRTVIWIVEKDTTAPLKVIPDPLGLTQFFCVPRPIMQTEGESSLTPVCPHNVYADLVKEIDDTTKRIKSIIEDMRIRAISDPKLQKVLEQLAEAQDGEVVSADVTENFTTAGGVPLEKLVLFWPVEKDALLLKELMAHREAIKQIIYEVTGLSDILRGSTNASETATAQQIKATWGSQRVQDLQQEVARLAREMFRMTAELIFGKFQDDTIRNMTLLPEPVDQQAIAASVPPPQPPQQPQPQQPMQVDPMSAQPPQMDPQQLEAIHQQQIEEAVAQAQQQAEQQFQQALAMLRDKLMFFRVDIETDSTIKADMTRDQEQMNQFVQTTGTFVQAVAGLVQIMPETRVPMFKLYCAFVRKQKLGKQAEDILDELEKAAAAPPVQEQQGPDPQAEAQAAQMQDQLADRQHQRDMESKQMDGQNIQLKNEAIPMKQEAARESFGMRMFERKIDAAMPPQAQKYNGQNDNGLQR